MSIVLQPITAANLADAVAVARIVFPYEVHADGFWPEIAYRESIAAQDPRLLYYVVYEGDEIVGITGHYPENARMGLGWFGVIPEARQRGLGERILRATIEIVTALGATELNLYSEDREEERAAHRLYRRLGFVREAGKDGLLYFGAKLPLVERESLSSALFKVIEDEIGGYEKAHPEMEGMCAAVHARVIIELSERGLLESVSRRDAVSTQCEP